MQNSNHAKDQEHEERTLHTSDWHNIVSLV